MKQHTCMFNFIATRKNVLYLCLTGLFIMGIFFTISPPFSKAIQPTIYSITPTTGSTNSETQVTIKGAGFESTPTAYLYGEDLILQGAVIRRAMLMVSMFQAIMPMLLMAALGSR